MRCILDTNVWIDGVAGRLYSQNNPAFRQAQARCPEPICKRIYEIAHLDWHRGKPVNLYISRDNEKLLPLYSYWNQHGHGVKIDAR